MTRYVFPDTTVLCNFAAVGRLDLLQSVLLRQGRWTEAVAEEVRKSARHLPTLATVRADGWLGEPVEIDEPSEVAQVERIRRAVFGGTPERATQHLGEAQTCYILKSWPPFQDSEWVSDDRDALRYAHRQGLPTFETLDLVSRAIQNGHVTAQAGYQLLRAMRGAERHLRLPASAAELAR